MTERDTHADRFATTTRRIETLSDAIFAISMTLLVLDIQMPDVSGRVGTSHVFRLFMQLWPHLGDYALSFCLLAIFWLIHHRQSRLVRKVDPPFLWMNIAALMFIALVPFSTSVERRYGDMHMVTAFFDINLLAAGLAFATQFWYASKNHRLVDSKLDRETISLWRKRSLIMPAASVTAIAASFANPRWSSSVYLAVPLVLAMLGHSRRRSSSGEPVQRAA